jgi:replicative DNA helicase Mcm
MDPESSEFDADIVETGMSKSQRDRIKNLKALIQDMQDDYDTGVPEEDLIDKALELGMGKNNSLHEIEKLKQKGEIFEPKTDHFRTT